MSSVQIIQSHIDRLLAELAKKNAEPVVQQVESGSLESTVVEHHDDEH